MDRKLLITIRNSGRWKEPGKGNGIGIPNVRNRLENAYPGRYALSIAEKDHWVIVELKLPL
jgi:LytS/YehU family sensor histidine kinase